MVMFAPPSSLLAAGNHVVLLGDVHGQWNRVQPILDREFPEGNGTALAVGDLVDYPPLENGHRIHFIPGNHEKFGLLEEARSGGSPLPSNYRPLFAGELRRVGGLSVAGLPGVHSPYFFDRDDGPMKYFTRKDFDALAALQWPVDVLLLHDAPFGVGFKKGGKDVGDPLLTDVIRAVKPALVFFGHHHMPFAGELEGTAIVGLDYPKRSYIVLDRASGGSALRMARHEAKLRNVRGSMEEWLYDWQTSPIDPGRVMEVGGLAVFPDEVPLNREEKFRDVLQNRMRAGVEKTLADRFAVELRKKGWANAEAAAANRAGLAVNTALPFAARYAAALEENPPPTMEGRKNLLGRLHDEMTRGVIPQAVPDILIAFEGLLQALGLVAS
jgi:predicted phosphodiesterase